MLTILQGDAIEQLGTLPDESVHCCVTSPPYWGLRDYGTAEWEGGDAGCYHKQADDMLERQFSAASTLAGTTTRQKESGKARYRCKCGAKRIDSQLGLEKTPEEYVAKMVAVFREVRRVLRKDGTLWLNMGDSYAAGGGTGLPGPNAVVGNTLIGCQRRAETPHGLKPKDLCGIPWRLAFALQADGWWLRLDIIWAKPNPMPESVTDRPTKAHEYIFLLTKSANYFYDAEAIKERSVDPEGSAARYESAFSGRPEGETVCPNDNDGQRYAPKGMREFTGNRNKRTVWTVATAPYPEAHFATYPPDLIKPCILAGTSAKGCCAKCGSPWERIVNKESFCDVARGTVPSSYRAIGQPQQGGVSCSTKTIGWQPTCKCADAPFVPISCTVLDPFAGSGTTGAVALELGRKAVLIELNPKYVELIKTRCNVTPGLQLA